jgi:SulP family sulfate permease
VTGFTSGIAVIIFSGQVRDLLGLRMDDVPAEFFPKWEAYAEHLATLNGWAVVVGGLSLAILLVWPRYVRWLPAPIVALIAATALVHAFEIPVETLGDRFGQISSAIPRPRLPSVDLATVRDLIGPAFAIALLGGIESLLSAVVSDGMIGGRHRSDMELVAQGIANVVTPLFGGIPATGAIARTATNVRNGGRTPIAGITHAVTLLIIMLFFGRLAGYIPFAALAAILVMVAYHMSEWRSFRTELSAPRGDVFVLGTTFVLTVVLDLVVAIQVGMVLAAFLFMRRMAEVTDVQAVTGELLDGEAEAEGRVVDQPSIAPGVEVYEINGPFFFGAAQKFRDRVESLTGRPKVLILRMRKVPAVDSTALHALRNVVRQGRGQHMLVLLSELQQQPRGALARSAALEELGEENIFPTFREALHRAEEHLASLALLGSS